jgi:hypothetical protein
MSGDADGYAPLSREEWRDCFRLLGVNAGAVPDVRALLKRAKVLQDALGWGGEPLWRLTALLDEANRRIA